MTPTKLKELVIGCTNYVFDFWAATAETLATDENKAIPAIRAMQNSIVTAASSVEARVYADDEFSERSVQPGIDLAYRAAVVSDPNRTDEWIAALSIDFENLDEHTRKLLHSRVDPQIDNSNLAGAEVRRLVLSYVCAKKSVTLDTFFTVVVETSDKKIALIPAPPDWHIPQPGGLYKALNHMEESTYEERLAIASRRFSVIDSAGAASMLDAHVRGQPMGPIH